MGQKNQSREFHHCTMGLEPAFSSHAYDAHEQTYHTGRRAHKVHGTIFDIDTRYRPHRRVGEGTYGMVCSARDSHSREEVAIKKIANALLDVDDLKPLLRELRLLRHFSHENILCLRDVMPPPVGGLSLWQDVYIVTELLDTDLHKVLQSDQPVSDEHVQFFIYQLLRGLKAIHSAGVLHRDLKPGNLLLKKDCDLKICDFGLARGVHPEGGKQSTKLTEYVVTRWYRAPELLVENESYDQAIDMWSVGCILAECLGRKALFPGKDYLQQLRMIIDVLGTPTKQELAFVNNPQAVHYITQLGKRIKKPFSELYPKSNLLATDLLSQLLCFDPSQRITAAAALPHPYFEELHIPEDEPTAPPFDFDFEREDISAAELRRLVYAEVCHFHPQLPALPPDAPAKQQVSKKAVKQ